MSGTYREYLDSVEGFDHAELEAYLDGGIAGVEAYEFETVNIELAQLGNGINVLRGEIESMLILGEPINVVIVQSDAFEFIFGG
jgi:hypothetical protein